MFYLQTNTRKKGLERYVDSLDMSSRSKLLMLKNGMLFVVANTADNTLLKLYDPKNLSVPIAERILPYQYSVFLQPQNDQVILTNHQGDHSDFLILSPKTLKIIGRLDPKILELDEDCYWSNAVLLDKNKFAVTVGVRKKFLFLVKVFDLTKNYIKVSETILSVQEEKFPLNGLPNFCTEMIKLSNTCFACRIQGERSLYFSVIILSLQQDVFPYLVQTNDFFIRRWMDPSEKASTGEFCRIGKGRFLTYYGSPDQVKIWRADGEIDGWSWKNFKDQFPPLGNFTTQKIKILPDEKNLLVMGSGSQVESSILFTFDIKNKKVKPLNLSNLNLSDFHILPSGQLLLMSNLSNFDNGLSIFVVDTMETLIYRKQKEHFKRAIDKVLTAWHPSPHSDVLPNDVIKMISFFLFSELEPAYQSEITSKENETKTGDVPPSIFPNVKRFFVGSEENKNRFSQESFRYKKCLTVSSCIKS